MKVYINCSEMYHTGLLRITASTVMLDYQGHIYTQPLNTLAMSVLCAFIMPLLTQALPYYNNHMGIHIINTSKTQQKINTCDHNKKCWTGITDDDDDDDDDEKTRFRSILFSSEPWLS